MRRVATPVVLLALGLLGCGGGGPASPSAVPGARCGDGVLDPGEWCDHGPANGDVPPASCSTGCVPMVCGDGLVGPGEECDDGPDNSDDRPAGCRTGCRLASCGDGVIDPGERCDDGPANSEVSPGACRLACVPARCGDGVVDPGEGCDRGTENGAPGSACRVDCSPTSCGDGILDPGEGCDHGAENSDVEPEACRTRCVPASCGDGVVDRHEQCDDGARNGDRTPGACRTTCLLAHCGDGVVDPGETCDGGVANSDFDSGACRTTCLPPSCGDRVIDPGEECDDGNHLPGDDCDASCLRERGPCGDGTLEPPEECDDGNPLDGDGCSSACAVEFETCGGLGPILDLVAVGTLDPWNGWVQHQGTIGASEPWLANATCEGSGRGRFYRYRPPIRGTLVVRGWSNAGFSATVQARERCDLASSVLACEPMSAGPLVLPGVDPAGEPIDLLLSPGGLGTYGIKARVLPDLPAGEACLLSRETGSCDATAGLVCHSADGSAGTCVPGIPAGGDCTSGVPCVEGLVCNASAGGSRCEDLCGNGAVDAAETCDDGNQVDADNCANDCTPAGDDCTWPFDLGAAWDPVAGRARWEGRFAWFSRPDTDYIDAVASFTAPAAGVYSFTVDSESGAPRLRLTVGGCGSGGREIDNREAIVAGEPVSISAQLVAGQTAWAVIGNYNTGSFALTVEEPNCGDGRTTPPETCDDGNPIAGDGCDPTCRLEGETCAAPTTIVWDPATRVATWRSTTIGRTDDHRGACLWVSYADAVGRFVAPAAGRYSFALDSSFGAAMYLWPGGCDGSAAELGCIGAPQPGPVRYLAPTLAAGDVIDVVVDGTSSSLKVSGPFELTVRPIVCGNGVLELPEDCDDGNSGSGDGCSPACLTEYVEVEPNADLAHATPVPAGVLVRGWSDPTYDYFAVPVAGDGRSYQVETWSGVPGSCLGRVDLALYDHTGYHPVPLASGCSSLSFTSTIPETVYLRLRTYDYRETPAASYFFRLNELGAGR